MKEMLKKYLDDKGVFKTFLPEYVFNIVESITGNVPLSMKKVIAISELMLFASQLRRPIKLNDGTLVPINSISFVLSSSGSSKDRTAASTRKCFAEGYKYISEKRVSLAIEKAIKQAEFAGVEDPDVNYKKYYEHPKPLFTSIGTSEGMIQYMNELEKDSIGAAYIYSGELGSELQTSSTIIDNIRLLSEMYDLGKKEVKIIKSKEHQSGEIKNLPFSALFIGSQDNILFDESIKNKFKLEFNTKLARRSFFTYCPDESVESQFDSIEEFLEFERIEEEEAVKYRNMVSDLSLKIATNNIKNKGNEPVTICKEAQDIFYAYKRYNEELSEGIDKRFPITKLVRKHAQWRALKLAGAFAIFNNNDCITELDYSQAVVFVESIIPDMLKFEIELKKETYEVFVDYIHSLKKETVTISAHELKKLGYIPPRGTLSSQLKELVQLANSYDEEGIYTIEKDSVVFDTIKKTDIIGASFLQCSGTKEQRMAKCVSGYSYEETTFDNLGTLLSEDYAFTPFKFKDGIRGKDNIESGTKWVCLDIDDSTLSIEDVHFMLQDINHHIALTSNPENKYKFRLIVELDSVVNISSKQWGKFVQSIAKYLSVKADNLPMSQIYFGYEGREVYSVVDKNVIEAKEHLAISAEETKPDVVYTAKQKLELKSNPLDTFFYAYEAEQGSGSRNMVRAIYHAKDIGMSKEETKALLDDIQEYWVHPMPQERYEKTILSQLDRVYDS